MVSTRATSTKEPQDGPLDQAVPLLDTVEEIIESVIQGSAPTVNPLNSGATAGNFGSPVTEPHFSLETLLSPVPTPVSHSDVSLQCSRAAVKLAVMRNRYRVLLAEVAALRPPVLLLPTPLQATGLAAMPEEFFKESEDFLRKAALEYSDIVVKHYHGLLTREQASLAHLWSSLSESQRAETDSLDRFLNPKQKEAFNKPLVIDPLPADLKLLSRPDPGSRMYTLIPTKEAKGFFASKAKTPSARKSDTHGSNGAIPKNKKKKDKTPLPNNTAVTTAAVTANRGGAPVKAPKKATPVSAPTSTVKPQPFREAGPPAQRRGGVPKKGPQGNFKAPPKTQGPPGRWLPYPRHQGSPFWPPGPQFWPGHQPYSWNGWPPNFNTPGGRGDGGRGSGNGR